MATQAEAKKVKAAAAKVKAAREAEGADLSVTSLSDWLAPAEPEGTKLPLPSGKVCLAINPGMEVFLEQGLIPNALLPIVRRAVSEGRGLSPKQVEEISEDPEVLADVIAFANRVTVASVVKPAVQMPPLWTEEDRIAGLCAADLVGDPAKDKRVDGILYADMIDLNDRLFILQWSVGGTKDLERFRIEQADAVEGVLARQATTGEAE